MEIKVDSKNRKKIIDVALRYKEELIKLVTEFEKAYDKEIDNDVKNAMVRDFYNLWFGLNHTKGRITIIDEILDRIAEYDTVTLNQDDINALGL